ncbi:MAG: restriction endonuclease subunit S [Kiritimatiellia bacterium]
MALLQRFCLASVMPSISLGRLKEIKIPLPPLVEQKKIADRFRAKIDEVALYRVKLERAIDSLREVYDQTISEDR